MAYITQTQANVFLEGIGEIAIDAEPGVNPQGTVEVFNIHIENASSRIEAVPFKDADKYNSPRFLNGFYTNASGVATSEPIPDDLLQATAFLAYWYRENPDTDRTLVGSELDASSSLVPALADLPLRVQSILFKYITDELKPGDSQYTRLESVRIGAAARGSSAAEVRGATQSAVPLSYRGE